MIIKKNFMGTLDITAMFKGMRKEQEFMTYALKEGADKVMIQSDTRIGYVNIKTGVVSLCKPKSSGAYFIDLNFLSDVDTLFPEELESLNQWLSRCSVSKV